MTDFAPPTGPPPPKVPEGWKAIWNTQYSEYFYVNIYTKQSQWDKPTEPVYPPGETTHHDAPPNYMPPASGADSRTSMDKKNLGTPGFGSNNPYAGGVSPGANISEDERLARQLQEEEEARARGQHGGIGSADGYYVQGSAPPNQYGQQGYNASPYPQTQSSYAAPATQDKSKSKGGFLGKLLGKATGSSHSSSHGGYPQQQHYGGQPGYRQQGYYPQQQSMYGRPPRKQGGMGMAGAGALGLGGGLLGGAMLGSALGDAGDGGGDGGGDYGGDGGGDYGGDGGGDFGGGDGGGDFGGGDMGGGD
ncbi:hypothetical protein K458DRAFT_384591 [Lentithecium fluviatile CBS 122367]|uniref:WW domain-containing protein n=1 Tax=Lentithecium fluviatile CBS 122367 TaxID=1168545 RepID=A0A6G1JCZ4_9PLEO|nr:hypothetical protein K458DRAFT_384591 [Lentithecium fluviatile CBS 122367]